MKPSNQQGSSLLDAIIAVAIISIGLIGAQSLSATLSKLTHYFASTYKTSLIDGMLCTLESDRHTLSCRVGNSTIIDDPNTTNPHYVFLPW